MSPSRHPRITAAAGVLLGAALVSGCAGTPAEPGEAEQRPSAPVEVTGTRITVTYDGGLLVWSAMPTRSPCSATAPEPSRSWTRTM
ncbi:hypothetical protein ACF3NT_08300 [Naumannella halotolerans]|uniref:hypothetical protein n=1 Tax=Naumannella halotolerans TaxID=993414 RepID=UPI00370D5DE6